MGLWRLEDLTPCHLSYLPSSWRKTVSFVSRLLNVFPFILYFQSVKISINDCYQMPLCNPLALSMQVLADSKVLITNVVMSPFLYLFVSSCAYLQQGFNSSMQAPLINFGFWHETNLDHCSFTRMLAASMEIFITPTTQRCCHVGTPFDVQTNQMSYLRMRGYITRWPIRMPITARRQRHMVLAP